MSLYSTDPDIVKRDREIARLQALVQTVHALAHSQGLLKSQLVANMDEIRRLTAPEASEENVVMTIDPDPRV